MELKQEHLTGSDPITMTRHLLMSQQTHPEAHGDFTLLLASIQLACKYVSSKVRRAGLVNIFGLADVNKNTSGDEVKKLDVLANEIFINSLRSSGKVAILGSEENDAPVEVEIQNQGKYVVAFDPLDGSSNIDANVSIGSIFGIWKRKSTGPATVEDLLQRGADQVAAGYCVYGSSTEIVLCLGGEVNCYTLDPSLGDFILTRTAIKIPKRGAIYSINEGNAGAWDEAITKYVHSKKFPEPGQKGASLRYIGSMVSDVHRTLVYGGIFMYPSDKKSPNGKLRLLYECSPLSLIIESAGGRASDGHRRILDIVPKTLHERTGIILGSADDVADVERLYTELKKTN